MVKSTPLLRKRIVKKRTLKFTRFQSDLYGGRLAESWRRPRGTWAPIQVLTTAWGEDSEETRRCPKLDTAQTTPPNSTCPTVSRSLSFTMHKNSTSCSWTTGPSLLKSHIMLAHAYECIYYRKELRLWREHNRLELRLLTLAERLELKKRNKRHDVNLFKFQIKRSN